MHLPKKIAIFQLEIFVDKSTFNLSLSNKPSDIVTTQYAKRFSKTFEKIDRINTIKSLHLFFNIIYFI